MNLFDLRRLDVHYFNTFSLLQILANCKKEVDEMVGLDQEARKRLLGSIKTPVSNILHIFCLNIFRMELLLKTLICTLYVLRKIQLS